MIMYRQALVLPGGLDRLDRAMREHAGRRHPRLRALLSGVPVRGLGRQERRRSHERGDVRYRGRGLRLFGDRASYIQCRPGERRDPYAVTPTFRQSACGVYLRFTRTACGYGSLLSQGRRNVFAVTTLNSSNALQNIKGTIVLAGAGKMGGAMLSGWLAQGLDAKRVAVIEPHPSAEISALPRKAFASIHRRRYRHCRHAGGRAEAADRSAKPARR